ncbi:hypothetical protein PUNSTDRAFT_136332 [Punctularia strigosozonata HHB-11173 SS5]|uniref:uncharacterized protein n=1 Tax=Punctularia strigosozonata (strain HHB-11173) TaxID=741275 RepID=UPI0004416E86|nr:uncharacterized protein PUNSTDRAFT_136332 [Punctularia strigosozonata HHB-11173 SS5]EIN06472.1 hypothetical protein PUNSTDRAFT_136332 [Punctularia strigosozonata HHB-11173 SS5]
MVKSKRGKARRTELDEAIAHIADILNRLYMESQDDTGDSDNEEDASPSSPPPPPPPPTVYAPPRQHVQTHEELSSPIDTLRNSLAALSAGGSISVQTSGPTVIPIMPNVHTVKPSACAASASTAASSAPCSSGGDIHSACDEVGEASTSDIRWDIVSTLVSGVPGAIYRHHTSRQAAEDAYIIALQAGRVSIIV